MSRKTKEDPSIIAFKSEDEVVLENDTIKTEPLDHSFEHPMETEDHIEVKLEFKDFQNYKLLKSCKDIDAKATLQSDMLLSKPPKDEPSNSNREEDGQFSGKQAKTRGGRGRRRGRGAARRGKGGSRGSHRRPNPANIEELNISSVEAPNRPKRMRVRLPTVQGPGEGSSAPPPAPAPPQADAARDVEGVPSQVPPSTMFVENGSGESSSEAGCSSPRPYSPPIDWDIELPLNYGSELSSDEDDDERLLLPPFPRTVGTYFDTPLDEEEEKEETITDATTPPPPQRETLGPYGLFDFQWEAFSSVPILAESRRERFTQINTGPVTPCADPYEIFTSIWDRQLVEHIVSETNKYAEQLASQLLRNNNLYPNSRINRWRVTTVDEVYVLFGIIMSMGVVVKSTMEEYWCTSADVFQTPGFCANMPFNRFQLLIKCLHFNDNYDILGKNLSVSEAKLFKISPIVTHLNTKFQAMYKLSQNISLDESLLLWNGRLDMNQIFNKADKVGIKTYEVCESQSGYLWRFEVHTHTGSPPEQPEDILNAFTPALVLRLLHGLENIGHTVWMDNYYNSPALARRLKCLGFDCVGTLRINRQFVPEALRNLTNDNKRKGEFYGFTSGDVDVMVWRHSSRVAMISTYHGNGVSGKRGSTQPTVISDYNIMMGGVDKKDKMLSLYQIERKRTRIWYKKLFWRLLNVSVLNSFIIHRKSAPTLALSHRNFRMALVNALLSKHSRTKKEYPLQVTPTQNASFHLTHYIANLRPNQSQHQRLRRQCVVCKKRVQTFCVGCDKAACLGPCFIQFHFP